MLERISFEGRDNPQARNAQQEKVKKGGEEFAKLAWGTIRANRSRKPLFLEGKDVSSQVYRVSKGIVMSVSYDLSGREAVHEVFRRGDVLGYEDMTMFGGQDRHSYRTLMLADTVVEQASFTMQEVSENLKFFLLSQQVKRTKKLFDEFLLMRRGGAVEKVAFSLLEFTEDFNLKIPIVSVTGDMLAAKTGISRQSVVLELGNLIQRNWITREGRKLMIQNPKLLAQRVKYIEPEKLFARHLGWKKAK